VDSRGMTRGIAPLLLGYQAFDREVNIAGIIFNRVGGARHAAKLRESVEHYTDIKVLGEVQNNPEQKEMLLSEIKSMDSTYVSLQKELKANPNDERIINAMIEHYQTKLEVMTYIVNQLKTIRNANQNSTENEKIRL